MHERNINKRLKINEYEPLLLLDRALPLRDLLGDREPKIKIVKIYFNYAINSSTKKSIRLQLKWAY